MDGVVNIDEGVFPTKGWSGMTLRLFNLKTRQWSLYWINSSTGELFPPVVGGFSGDARRVLRRRHRRGTADQGRVSLDAARPDAARWEQSFSLDGKEWEKNWIIEHRRVKG